MVTLYRQLVLRNLDSGGIVGTVVSVNEASVLRLGKEDGAGQLGQERDLPRGFVGAKRAPEHIVNLGSGEAGGRGRL